MNQSQFFNKTSSKRFSLFSSYAEKNEHAQDKVDLSVRLRDYRHADDVETKRNPEITETISKSELVSFYCFHYILIHFLSR